MSSYSIDMDVIFKKLDAIPPTEVLKLLGEPIRKKKSIGENHYKCLCPFPGHHDQGIGSFDVNDQKGIAKCFACQKGGRPVRLYRDLAGLKTDYEAAVYFAEDIGLITKNDRHKLLRESNESDVENKKNKLISVASSCGTSYKEPEMKPTEHRSIFYQEFIRQIPLLKKDHDYLKEVRKISEHYEQYFFGQPTKQVIKNIMPKVFMSLGWDFEDYLGIPGIYVQYGSKEDKEDKINGKISMVSHNNECFGLAIPDIHGQISGIQFRNYKPNADGLRYFMLSSGFINSGRYVRMGDGRSGLAPIGFLPARNRTPLSRIAITEGMFKAISLAEHGYQTFFLQGINASTELVPTLEEYLSEHPEQERSIVLAFDADLKSNPQVALAVNNVYCSLLDAGYHIAFLSWDEQYGKGIDDVCINGNGAHVRMIKAEPFVAKYLTPQINGLREESEKKRQKFMQGR